jgi:hypothetical protein
MNWMPASDLAVAGGTRIIDDTVIGVRGTPYSCPDVSAVGTTPSGCTNGPSTPLRGSRLPPGQLRGRHSPDRWARVRPDGKG